jgi:nicotinamidase-related amidase
VIKFKGRQIPETLTEIVDPAHTVLVVHELLNDFCAEGGAWDKAGRRIDASEILPATIKTIEVARAACIRVIYVRYTRHTDYSSHSDPAIRKAWNMISGEPVNNLALSTIEGTWGWEFLDEVKPEPDDLVLRKYRPDAFYSTHLDDLLRWNGIKSIVLVGNGAEIGIVPTVMHGFNLGYFCVVVEDAVLTVDPARREDALRYIADWGLVATQREVTDVWANKSA